MWQGVLRSRKLAEGEGLAHALGRHVGALAAGALEQVPTPFNISVTRRSSQSIATSRQNISDLLYGYWTEQVPALLRVDLSRTAGLQRTVLARRHVVHTLLAALLHHP